MKVQMSIAFFTLSGLFSAVVLSYGIEVIENVNESDEENSQGSSSTVVNNDQNNETSVSSTNNNETTYKNNWSSAPQPEDMHRIITPVVITTPHGDKQKNFTASPMLDAIYNPEYHQFNHEHYQKTAQKHKSHDSGYHSSKEEDDDGQKKHHYSQPLLPDMFLTQQYLKAQQQKEQDEYKSKNNNQNVLKPAIPQAKSNAFNFNSDAISYKPLKFDSDFPSTLFTSDKGGSSAEFGNNDKKQVPFHYTLPSPIKSNTHPYPYQNPYSSSEKDLEPPTTTSSMAKQYHPGSWADGYKTGINYQEGEKTSMWKKVLNMLAAFIPLGLFLAALPPNVLTINTTQPDLPSRQRSVDHPDSGQIDAMSFPILDLLDKYGIDSLDDPECENRIFCEMSRLGGEPSGNIIQKAFWHLAHDTPDKTADAMGMKELFKAVRTDACNIYRCKEKNKPSTTATTNTKLKLKEEKK